MADLPEWVTSEHMGVFSSKEEKLETFLQLKNIAHLNARIEVAITEAEAKRLAKLAEMTGVTRYIPDAVKDGLKLVCQIAPYAEHLPEDKRLDFIQLAAKVAKSVCSVLGFEE